MKEIKDFLKYKALLLATFLPLFVLAASDAGDSYGLNDNYGLNTAIRGTGVLTRRPNDIVTYIINALLGLLGTLFTVLIILGGFKWMTARGNKEMVQEARNLIVNASIGLLIVGISYAIVRFVIGAFNQSSGPCNPEDPNCGGAIET